MVAARIAALLCASTVLVAQACTNGAPQWDQATWHISGIFRKKVTPEGQL